MVPREIGSRQDLLTGNLARHGDGSRRILRPHRCRATWLWGAACQLRSSSDVSSRASAKQRASATTPPGHNLRPSGGATRRRPVAACRRRKAELGDLGGIKDLPRLVGARGRHSAQGLARRPRSPGLGAPSQSPVHHASSSIGKAI